MCMCTWTFVSSSPCLSLTRAEGGSRRDGASKKTRADGDVDARCEDFSKKARADGEVVGRC